MKKLVVLVLSVVFSLVMLAGCGSSSSGSAASVASTSASASSSASAASSVASSQGSAASASASASSTASASSAASAATSASSASVANQDAFVIETLAKAKELGSTKQALDLLKEANDKVFDQRLYKAYEKLYRQQWKKTSSDEVFEPDEQEPNGRVQHFDYEWNADGTSMLEHAWSSDKDKSFESDSYYRHTYDEAGNLLFDQWYTDASLADVWFQTEYRYDSAGNEIRMTATRFDEFGVVYDRECGYDEHNNELYRHDLVHSWYYDSNEDIIWYDNENEYDAAGNLVKVIRRNEAGEIERVSEHVYDKLGNRVKTTNYSADGKVKSTNEREYNKYGSMTKSVNYNAEGKVSSRTEREYDGNGHMTRDAQYDGLGTLLYEETFELDENGNAAKETSYDGETSWSAEYAYTFIPLK